MKRKLDDHVNAVGKGSKIQKFHKSVKPKKGGKKCYQCGETGHLAKNSNCPARSETCTKCGLIGHREKCCRTNTKKLNGKPSKASNVDISEVNSENEFIFQVIKISGKGDIHIEVSGVSVNMLIDSGPTYNIIDEKTWYMLKQRKICCTSERAERELCAYGQTELLKTLGKFRSKVRRNITNVTSEEEFVVIKGEAKAMM